MRAAQRLRGHRRHHQLHQHLQPLRHARRAGLLAKKAVERGLHVKPCVKTSLAPGSKVVTDYLDDAGLMPYLEALGFHLVGYGCTTCIAEGTPVLLANGTARRIEQMPNAGGAVLFGPTADGRLSMAVQTEAWTKACASVSRSSCRMAARCLHTGP